MIRKEDILVSIGLPVYNGSDTVIRALDSLLAQTYKNFELIISDNASTDETKKICEAYAAKDARIKYIRQKENLGFVKNVYYVLGKAKGEYFMWIADDDWWEPRYIEALVAVLDKNHQYGVAQSSFKRILVGGEFHSEMFFEGKKNVTLDSHFSVYEKSFVNDSGLNHFIYGLFRRALLYRAVFERPLTVEQSWDKILVSEFAFATKFYCVPEILRFSEQRRKLPHSTKTHYHPTRYPGDKLRPVWFLPKAYSMLLLRSLSRVLGSKVVPFWRKPLVFVALSVVIWRERRRFIGFSYRDFERFFRSRASLS